MHITNKKMLDEAIVELERKKVVQHYAMMEQLEKTKESLKPGNLVKDSFSRITHSSAARSSIIKAVAGIGVGMITKKLFIGKSTSLVKKILGNAVRLGVTKTAISNTDKVRAYGSAIYNNLFKKKSDHKIIR